MQLTRDLFAIAKFLFIQTHAVKKRGLVGVLQVRCDKRMLLWLQVVANLILMIGVNVAGIFVYDRRDQVHRKLFGVIRACSLASLRIQDERSKLVFHLHLDDCYPLYLHSDAVTFCLLVFFFLSAHGLWRTFRKKVSYDRLETFLKCSLNLNLIGKLAVF